MTHVRAFRPGDVEARSIDPTKFRTKPVNSCWLRPPRRAPAPPPPPECERPRCDEPAVDGGHCAEHDHEEQEWRSIDVADVTRIRQRLRGHPEGSTAPRHPEGSVDG